MEEQLKKLTDDIKQKVIVPFDKSETKLRIVLKLLSILGWDPFAPNEIKMDYDESGVRTDFALVINSKVKVLIDVHPLDSNLDSHTDKMASYAEHEDAEVSLITNGYEWIFILSDVGEKTPSKVINIDVLNDPYNLVSYHFLKLLQKENISCGATTETIRNILRENKRVNAINENMPKAWNSLFESDSLTQLKELINKTLVRICGYPAKEAELQEFIDEHAGLLTLRIEKSAMEKKVLYDSHGIPGSLRPFKKTTNSEHFTHKKPIFFELEDRRDAVNSWSNLLVRVCNMIAERHRDDFTERIFSYKNNKRNFFSEDPTQLRKGKRILLTKVYVESNLNSNMIVQLCNDICQLFEHGTIKVECEEKSY